VNSQCLSLVCICFCIFTAPAFAITNPVSAPNNRFGIHIIDENDLDPAAALVNSNGGEYGYVTLVIRQDDRNVEKWQNIFNRMRRLKLIPIVRLATQAESNYWQKPKVDQAKEWAQFLHSLNWVVKNRYVILFNEPNHSKEWGGEIKPHEYAIIYDAFYQALKNTSSDFFVLPAGMDVSASNGGDTMDAVQFWKFMQSTDKDIFKKIDGWNSHSYPNPNFSGKVTDTGRGSIRTYRWELAFLQALGLDPNIPIFITETGWQHTQGQGGLRGLYPPDKTAPFYSQAYSFIWVDDNLVTITPFVLNYQSPPFAQFSWTQNDQGETYPQYQAVQLLPKTTGQPMIDRRAEIIPQNVPDTLVTGSVYQFSLQLINSGQSVFNPEDYQVKIDSLLVNENQAQNPIPQIEPGTSVIIHPVIKTPKEPGAYDFTATVYYQNTPISVSYYNNIRLIHPPSLLVKAQTWYKKQSSGGDFALLVYYQDNLVKKIEPFTVIDGIGTVPEIRDVIPNNEYRFVLTKPYYLPRQTIRVLSTNRTIVEFDRLIPVDFYPDGALSLKDLWYALTHPRLTVSLLIAR
jgi:hypothetical protein